MTAGRGSLTTGGTATYSSVATATARPRASSRVRRQERRWLASCCGGECRPGGQLSGFAWEGDLNARL